MNVIDLFSNKKYFDNWYQIAITIIYHLTKMTYFISSTCISKHFQFDAFEIKPNHSLPLSLSLKRSWNIYLSYTEAFYSTLRNVLLKYHAHEINKLFLYQDTKTSFHQGILQKQTSGLIMIFFPYVLLWVSLGACSLLYALKYETYLSFFFTANKPIPLCIQKITFKNVWLIFIRDRTVSTWIHLNDKIGM